MATKKIAATKTTAASKVTKAATPPTVVAKGRTDAVAVAGKALAAAATKPMRVGKPAFGANAKTSAVKPSIAGALPEVPQHVVKNLKGLREAMDKYPKATGYTTDRKFGIDIVSLFNTRGRKIAEIKLIAKPTARADKL